MGIPQPFAARNWARALLSGRQCPNILALRFRPLVPYATLALATFLTFCNALRAPFIFDDYALLNDATIASSQGWLLSFQPAQTRPLTWLSFWLSRVVFGDYPAGWHAVSLLLHVAAALLLLQVLDRLIPHDQAVVAAFLFALHPIQPEPVAYVFARGTLLATVLCLLAMRSWVHGRYWPAVAWFGFALLAKEECAAFPAFLLLHHFATDRKPAQRRPILMMLALAAAAVVRVAVIAATNPGSGAGEHAGVAPLTYFATQGPVILRYFQLLAIPVGFSIDPDIAPPASWKAVLSWLALIAAACLATLRFRGAREGFWFLGGLLLLLPTSSIFPVADLAADRRVYLPMLGFSVFGAMLLRRTTMPVVLTAGAIVLGMLSFARADLWASPAALWEDAMRMAPGKIRPRLQLSRIQPPEQAVPFLLETKAMAPDDPAVATELGRVYLALSKPSEALAEFGRAVALRPLDPSSRNNRGVALLALGLREHAISDFRIALESEPCLFDAHLNLHRLRWPTPPPEGCRFTPEQIRQLQ